MSSKVLRDAIRAEWPARLPTLPYVDTINVAVPRPLPPVWGTLGFNVSARNHVTMGSRPWVEESGTVAFFVASKSGRGDAEGISAGRLIQTSWEGFYSRDFWFTSVGAPQQIDVEVEGDWLLFSVECSYRVQERVTLK